MDTDILYRWDNQQAGILDPARQSKANDIQKMIHTSFPEYEDRIRVIPIKFPIKSSGKATMTNEEYLSTSKGEGGHIVGVLRYKIDQEKRPILNYTTFMSSQFVFRDEGHSNLFILTGTGVQKVKDKLYSIKQTKLEDVIEICNGIVKFYQLGSLMDATHRNMAEIDFIGNGVAFEGFMIEFSDSAKEAHEDEYSSQEEPSSLFIRGGAKRGREDLREVPLGFESVLDQISREDPIPKLAFQQIEFNECPAKAGRRKTKRVTKKKRKTIRKKL